MRSLLKLFFILVPVILFFGCQPENEFINKNPPIANAGSSATIQLPVNTVTMTGTGKTENGRITGYLWSLVSGPNIPSIVSPSSATTVINNLIAGTYIFQFMVIDSIGLSGVDTASVIVRPGVPQTLTLQPANSSENEMSYAGNNNGSNLGGHVICLNTEAWTIGGVPLFIRGAFRFDLSSIPPSATIISAKLSLYSNPTPINGDQISANSGPNNSFYIRRIIGNWTAATATWQNQPATTTTDQISIPSTTQAFLDLVDIDVATLVSSMRSTNNYGFMIQLQNEVTYNTRQFCSSYHPIAAKRPKLVVVYQ